MTFGIVIKIMSSTFLDRLSMDKMEITSEYHRIRISTGLTFLYSALIGTIIILFAVRGIVRPIKRISKASKDVAKGNFDVEVEVRSADEIGQLTTDFNLMVKELKNIDILRKDFVSNVSHEYKTPITSIKGFAKLIKDGNLTSEQLSEYSEIIVNESERLSLLSSNLLKLSKLDSRLIRDQESVFPLDEQIRKTVLILQGLWEKKKLDFDIDLDEISIKGHEHLLQEVWLNLIQNAIKFSEECGTIKISLHRNFDKAVVVISDNGIGISGEDKEHIFERFYKGDKSRSKDGNGLGLVIVKKIIEISSGKIDFQSEPQKGSTFIIELPLNNA